MMLGFGLFSAVVGQLDSDGPMRSASIVVGQCGGTRGGEQRGNDRHRRGAEADLHRVPRLRDCRGHARRAIARRPRPDDASRFGWASVRLGLIIFGIVGLCEGVLFTRPIISFITKSDAVRAAALFPMHIVGIVTPIIAVAMILSEALFGAGNSKFVAVAQLALVFGCLLPLALVLGVVFHMALVGVWVAACVYFVFAALTMTLKFRQGSWKPSCCNGPRRSPRDRDVGPGIGVL